MLCSSSPPLWLLIIAARLCFCACLLPSLLCVFCSSLFVGLLFFSLRVEQVVGFVLLSICLPLSCVVFYVVPLLVHNFSSLNSLIYHSPPPICHPLLIHTVGLLSLLLPSICGLPSSALNHLIHAISYYNSLFTLHVYLP